MNKLSPSYIQPAQPVELTEAQRLKARVRALSRATAKSILPRHQAALVDNLDGLALAQLLLAHVGRPVTVPTQPAPASDDGGPRADEMTAEESARRKVRELEKPFAESFRLPREIGSRRTWI